MSNLVLACLAAVMLSPVVQAQPDPSGDADFTIFIRGQRVGSEHVTMTRDADGWTVSAHGSSGAPLNMSFDTFVASYGPDWQARALDINGLLRGQPMSLRTSFTAGQATSTVVQAGQQGTLTHAVSPTTVILPNNFFAAYEALSQRLQATSVGDTLPVYVAPQTEMAVRIDRITPRRIDLPGTRHDLRQFDLIFPNPGGPLQVEVWVDARGRLARLVIPAATLTVVRDDLSTVMARLDSFSHPRDEQVFIPGNGFNLAATITPPATTSGRAPVVILLAGSGAQDRDETVFGIPILGQIAARLSDAGFFVVRYDKRGVGQSGGRIETHSLDAFTDDTRAVVDWVRRRRDIDRDRIALVGHSEGGAVALLTAGRMRGDVAAIGLLAAPGATGRDTTLAQQRYVLDQANEPEDSRQDKIALQHRVMDAVLTGQGWDTIPPELRRQADTPWFKSWLSWDPAAVVRRTNQPVLILQGALDVQVPPSHADALEKLARARNGRAGREVRKVIVPGVNHLLVPAVTGDLSEYGALPDRNVATAITDPLITWLQETLTRR